MLTWEGSIEFRIEVLAIEMFFLMVFVSCFLSTKVKVEDKYMPYVGNGNVAMKINDPAIFLAGVFNGKGLDFSHVSHRATIPNYLQSIVFQSGQKDISYELEVKKGMFYRYSTIVQSSKSYAIKETFYAHRSLTKLLVYEISSTKKLENPVCFDIKNSSGTDDLHITEVKKYGNVTLFQAKTIIEETSWTGLQSFTFLKPSNTHFCRDFENPFRFLITFDDTIENYEKYMSAKDLSDSHIDSWNDIWTSGISVEGNDELNTIIENSIYYILSSLTPNGNYSLSPGSLSSNSYNGHTFWDAETWMYPILPPLYPTFAKSCLNYRLERRYGSSLKAQLNGYKGYMFPWESATSGTEVCPLSAPTGKLEQHISSDVVLGFRNYYNMFERVMSKSEKLEFLDLVVGVANFWISRATIRPSNTSAYDIILVIPPDEYHTGSNSVFTNAGAQMSLQFASKLAKTLDPSKLNPKWDDVASRLYFPLKNIDGKLIDWEFEEYKGDKIKQADVVLLTYPLMWPDSRTRDDLEYYESKIDPNGPSMTFGIHAIEWLQLGNLTAAHQNFLMSYQYNVQPPFYVWTEVRGGSGAVNFITGAGNFLQGLVFGYAGMRILEDKLRFSPVLLENTKSFTINNIHYQENLFSMTIGKEKFSMVCEKGKFIVEMLKSKKKYSFMKGTKMSFDNQEFVLYIE